MKKKATIAAPTCGSCGQESARLTDGREVYPNRPDLHDKAIWRCDGCGAYVGCHPGTTRPLGTPADTNLRGARMLLHNLKVDPLWKTADQIGLYRPEDDKARMVIQRAARHRVYAFLAERMEIKQAECHIGNFTIDQCREAWLALRGITYSQIRRWYHERKARKAAKTQASDSEGAAA